MPVVGGGAELPRLGRRRDTRASAIVSNAACTGAIGPYGARAGQPLEEAQAAAPARGTIPTPTSGRPM